MSRGDLDMKMTQDEMNERMKHYNVQGLSIAQMNNGNLSVVNSYGVLEAGFDEKVSNGTIFNSCSISKFATALLVLKLVEEGMLELDQDINEILRSWKVPENEFTRNKKVTLRNLLSHQSGVIDPEESFSEYDPTQGFPTMFDLIEGRSGYCHEPIEVKYEPESEFHYSDAGFCIIELLVEDVSGKPFKVLMNEMIFEPLHMGNSTLEHNILEKTNNRFASGHHKDGKVVEGKYPIYPYLAAAGLWSTPTDLACLGMEVVHSLKGNGKLGISYRMIKEMMTPQGCPQWAGLGIFLDNSGQDLQISSLGWGVGFQSIIIFYPHLGTGAFIMTNSDLGIHQTKGLIGEIVNSLDLVSL